MNIKNAPMLHWFSAIFNNNFLPSLTTQQKKIAAIVAAAISALTLSCLFVYCWRKSRKVTPTVNEKNIPNPCEQVNLTHRLEEKSARTQEGAALEQNAPLVETGLEKGEPSEREMSVGVDGNIENKQNKNDGVLDDEKLISKNSSGILQQHPQKSSEQPEDYDYYAISQLARDGKMDEAIAKFEAFLTKYPSNWHILKDYAHVLVVNDRFADAILQYEKIMAIEPDNRVVVKDYLICLMKLAKADNAQSVYENYQRSCPEDVSVALAYLHELYLSDKHQEAETLCESLYQKHPNESALVEKYALILKTIKKENVALAIYESYVKNNPDDLPMLDQYAYLLFLTDDYLKAEPLQRKLKDKQPDDRPSANYYAKILIKLGRLTEGWATYESFLTRHPDDTKMLAAYASELLAQNRCNEALEQTKKRLAIEPDVNFDCYLINLLKLGKFNEAESECDAYLSRHPDDVQLLSAYAHQLFMNDKPKEAAAQYRKILVIDPQNKSAEEWLAMNVLRL